MSFEPGNGDPVGAGTAVVFLDPDEAGKKALGVEGAHGCFGFVTLQRYNVATLERLNV